MNLRKPLTRGQVSLEYFIIFSLIVALTTISFVSLLPQIRNALQGDNGVLRKATDTIVNADR